MTFYLIGFAIFFVSFFKPKKAFLTYLIFRTVLVTNISIVSFPNLPLLTLEMFLDIWFVFLYFLNKKNHSYYEYNSLFPYRNCFILIFFSNLLSSFLSIAGFLNEIPSLIGNLFSNILIVYLIRKNVSKFSDYKYIMNGLTYVFLFCSIYCFIEYCLGYNPIIDYEMKFMVDKSKIIDFRYFGEIDTYRGYRCQSLFESAIGGGINFALFSIFALYSFSNKINFGNNFLIYLVGLLCIPCILLTKSRTGLVFLIVGILSCVSLKNLRGKIILFLFVTIFLIILIVICVDPTFIGDINLYSGGSSFEMRINQFNAAFNIIDGNKLFGLGTKFINYVNTADSSLLLGMESIWLSSIVEFGYFGTIVYLIFAFYSVFILPIKYKSAPIFWLSLAYWLISTVTSTPGFKNHLYYLILFYFIKQKNIKFYYTYNVLSTKKIFHERNFKNNKIWKGYI